MTTTLSGYLILAAALFCIGLFGILVRRNAISILMCIELMLNAVNINLVAFARFVKPMPGMILAGQAFAIFVMTVAAAEAAIGLAIIFVVYRNMKHVNVDDVDILRW